MVNMLGFKKELQRLNKQNAIKGKVKHGLYDILNDLTKARLSSLAQLYEVTGRSKMTKEQLVDGLFEAILERKYLEPALLISRQEEWDLFEQLLKSSSLQFAEQDTSINPGIYDFLMNAGFVFSYYTDGSLYFVIPDEIKREYNSLNLQKFTYIRELFQKVYDYTMALTNLYGAFKPELLIDIFNEQNNEQMSKEEFMLILERHLSRQQAFSVYDGYIISDYFEYGEDEEFEQLLLNIKNKSYYIPDKKELLKYADDLYFEMTPQLVALKEYVLKNMCDDEQRVEYLIDDIQLACSTEAPLQEIFFEFERKRIEFSGMPQMNKVMGLITDVYNNTRLWSNRGHTPSELSNFSKTPNSKVIPFPTERSEKIGRNEPCPCGSGKKYKRCCGK